MAKGNHGQDRERRSPGDDTGVGLDVDRVLAAAGLDEPRLESDLDLDVDFDIEADSDVLDERRPFRFGTPPPPTHEAPIPGAPVDPFANTISEPMRLPGSTPLNSMRAVQRELDSAEGGRAASHLQVAEMLQSRMKQRGYTPIGTPVALNSVPVVLQEATPQGSPAAGQPRAAEGATRDVDVVKSDSDAYDTREVMVQAPDPFEDEGELDLDVDVPGFDAESAAADETAPPSDVRAAATQSLTPSGVPAAEAPTRPIQPAPMLSAEAPTKPVPRSAGPIPGAPGEHPTQMLTDLPVEALARQRRDSVEKTDKSERRRVRHGEDERILGRAALGAREIAGVREERNTARDRSVEALLQEYVEEPVMPTPAADASGVVPGAQVFKRRRRRR